MPYKELIEFDKSQIVMGINLQKKVQERTILMGAMYGKLVIFLIMLCLIDEVSQPWSNTKFFSKTSCLYTDAKQHYIK